MLLAGNNNLITVNSAIISSPSVTLDGSGLVSRGSVSRINGDLINNGSVSIFDYANLLVSGNYLQTPNAFFYAYNLKIGPIRPYLLSVYGHADIAGFVFFNVSVHGTFTETVVNGLGGINGMFNNGTFINSNGYQSMLSYSGTYVNLVITPEHEEPLPWWISVLFLLGVGGGLLLLIGAGIAIKRKCRGYTIVADLDMQPQNISPDQQNNPQTPPTNTRRWSIKKLDFEIK